MKRVTRRYMFLGAIALATLVMAVAVYSCNREGAKKVVVMFSFDENQYSYALFRESLEEAFKKRKQSVDISYYYIDCLLRSHNDEINECQRILDECQRNGKPDLIMTVGDEVTYSTPMTH